MRAIIATTTAIAAAGLIAASATAFGPAERKAKELAAWTPAGEPISCVRTRDIQSTTVLSDTVIDFKMRGGKRYRNVLPMRCPTLGSEQRFSHKSITSELCDVDIITVLTLNGAAQLDSGPSCGLGEFQPVVKAQGQS